MRPIIYLVRMVRQFEGRWEDIPEDNIEHDHEHNHKKTPEDAREYS